MQNKKYDKKFVSIALEHGVFDFSCFFIGLDFIDEIRQCY